MKGLWKVNTTHAEGVTIPAGIATTATTATVTTEGSEADGYVTSAAPHGLTTGDAAHLNLDGGTAQGLTDEGLYYVVVVDATKVSLATSKANALAGTVVAINGNAGAGDLFPVVFFPSGFLWVGNVGNLQVIAAGDVDNGEILSTAQFNGVPVGPFGSLIVKGICSNGTTAADIVVQY